MGANGIDLNNDGDLDVTVAGIEHYKVQSDGAGKDVINAGGYHGDRRGVPQSLDGLFTGDFGIEAERPGAGTLRLPPRGIRSQAAGCHDKTLTGGAGSDRISATGDGYNTVAPGAGDDFMAQWHRTGHGGTTSTTRRRRTPSTPTSQATR